TGSSLPVARCDRDRGEDRNAYGRDAPYPPRVAPSQGLRDRVYSDRHSRILHLHEPPQIQDYTVRNDAKAPLPRFGRRAFAVCVREARYFRPPACTPVWTPVGAGTAPGSPTPPPPLPF